MKRLLLYALIVTFAAPLLMQAQRGYGPPPRDYDRRDYDRRDYGRPRSGPGDRVARVIADCENRTDQFQVSLRRALEYSRLRDTNREDELNRDAARLERSLNRVREAWNQYRDVRRTREHVSRAIDVSRDINRTMVRRRLNPEVQRQWDVVRSELNHLAEVFELPRIGW